MSRYVLVEHSYLSPDLALREIPCMNIRIACAVLQSTNELVEFSGRNSLTRDCEHLIRRDSPLHASLPGAGAQRGNFFVTHALRRRVCGSLAQPDNDTADGVTLAEVNMTLSDVRLQTRVAQLGFKVALNFPVALVEMAPRRVAAGTGNCFSEPPPLKITSL